MSVGVLVSLLLVASPTRAGDPPRLGFRGPPAHALPLIATAFSRPAVQPLSL